MNNKGFAITGILYSVLIMFLVVLLSFLAVLSGRKNFFDRTVEEIKKDLESYNSGINNTKYNFAYTGNYQTFTAPSSGQYRVELWGASGGSNNPNFSRGSYTAGSITLYKGQQLYVYVGEQGKNTIPTNNYFFNGGGRGGNGTTVGYGGGGATDVRTVLPGGKYRYIRDYINGSSSNSGNHWVEINATANFVNGATFNGVKIGGTYTGTFQINYGYLGTANDGEIMVTAGTFTNLGGNSYTQSDTKEIQSQLEGSTVSGMEFIMFIGSDPSRFTFYNEFATRLFIPVKYINNAWYYDTNVGLATFTPNANDSIVGVINKAITTTGYTSASLCSYPFTANVSLGTTVTSDGTITRGNLITDGNYTDGIDGANGYAYTTEAELKYIEIDLGVEYDLSTIQIWHWYLDGRSYNNTKTILYNATHSVSDVIADSSISGTYPETLSGVTRPADSVSLMSRIMVAGGGGGSVYYDPSTTVQVLAGRHSFAGAQTGLMGDYNRSQGDANQYGLGGKYNGDGLAGTNLNGTTGTATNGIFGYGGYALNNSTTVGAGGGGGGYFGGGAGGSTNTYGGGGGGGSSFVAGCAYCLSRNPYYPVNTTLSFTDIAITAGNAPMISPEGIEQSVGNLGNGFARITLLTPTNSARISYGLTSNYKFDDFQEPTTNIVPSINPFFAAWGTPLPTGTSQYFTSPSGSQGIYANINYPAGDGGVCWNSINNDALTTVLPSTTYTVSAVIKWSGSPTLTANVLYLRQYDASSTQVAEVGIYNSANLTSLGDGWYKVYGTFTTSSTTTSVRIQSYQYTPSIEIWMYDFQLEQKSYSTPYVAATRSGTVRDYAEKNISATLQTTTTPKWTTDSKIGSGAYKFYGTNQFILSDQAYVLDGSQTFGAWIKPVATDNLRGIVSRHTYSSSPPANLGLNIFDGKLAISVGYTDGTREYENKRSTATIPLNVWSYVVMTYDITLNKISYYINGEFDSAHNLTKTVNFTSTKLLIGEWALDHNGYYFNGNIDDVQIYGRALLPEEIKAIYDAGNS